MRTVLIPVVAALTVLAAGCAGDDDDAGGEGRRTVVAAFFPLAEAVRLTGADVEVVDLTPPGAEPHDLELTTDQVDAVLDADVAIVLGGGFQPAVEEVADDRDGTTVVVLDDLGLDVDDPHVWLDPTVMADIVRLVADALEVAPPSSAPLEELDEKFETTLADCDRDLVVASHGAYGHLTDRYGLRQESITGLVPEEEPDPARLGDLADLVEREGATTVYVEPLLPTAAAETLAREAGGETAVLDPLESDPDVGYIEAMEANLEALALGLGCG